MRVITPNGSTDRSRRRFLSATTAIAVAGLMAGAAALGNTGRGASTTSAGSLAIEGLGDASGVAWTGDAKDHPGYGPVAAVDVSWTGDAKDHPGYGAVAASIPTRTIEPDR
jgi:hypothetical protein